MTNNLVTTFAQDGYRLVFSANQIMVANVTKPNIPQQEDCYKPSRIPAPGQQEPAGFIGGN